MSMWVPFLVSCFGVTAALKRANINPFNFTLIRNDLPPDLTQAEAQMLTVTSGAERNVCMNKHFVPELYVLGGIKTSSTLLCTQLRRSPGVQWRLGSDKLYGDPIHPASWKEGHFFDNNEKGGVNFLTSSFPECSKDVRKVAVEGAARYSADFRVPSEIAQWYGDLKNRLSFVLLIRDPIARLHSHFTHSKRDGWCKEFKRMAFFQLADHILHEKHDNYFFAREGPEGAGCGDFMEGSMWKDILERWFGHFHPRQFLIVPEKYNVAPGKDGRTAQKPAEFIWNMLGIKGLSQDVIMTRTSANINPNHLQLWDELDFNRYALLRELYANRWGPAAIAGVLKGSGAMLYDYKGAPNDVDAIAYWVEHNW